MLPLGRARWRDWRDPALAPLIDDDAPAGRFRFVGRGKHYVGSGEPLRRLLPNEEVELTHGQLRAFGRHVRAGGGTTTSRVIDVRLRVCDARTISPVAAAASFSTRSWVNHGRVHCGNQVT